MVDVHTALPGRVVSYDASKKVADIELVTRRQLPSVEGDPVVEKLPLLRNVRIGWLQAGGMFLHMPLAAGDHVLVIFCESSIAQWRSTGKESLAGDQTRHALSYAWALPVASPDAQAAAQTVVPGVTHLGGGTLVVGDITSKFVALAEKVNDNFEAIKDMFDSWLPVANDGGAALKTASADLVFADVASTNLKAK
jgi:hypothetical protein